MSALINIVTSGSPRLEAMRALIFHYKKMLKKYNVINTIDIAESRGNGLRQLKCEAERIRLFVKPFRCKVLLDPEGRIYDSNDFALWLKKRISYGESIVFIIGSSHGFDINFKKEISESLSLSKMTFQHDMSYILLLEQLYRAFSIIYNTAYHK